MSRKDRIYDALYLELLPEHCLIEDESHLHHVPENAQSHFKITIVSAQFNQLTRIARHRLVQKLLENEFKVGLHALSLHLFTQQEWEVKGGDIPSSPPCRGGKHKEFG